MASVLAGDVYPIYSADMFFEIDLGTYKIDPTKLKYAHEWCIKQVEDRMKASVQKIFVANTFTQEWEMENYFKLAEVNGYRVHSIIVENRHGGENIHGVPREKVEQMVDRFQTKI